MQAGFVIKLGFLRGGLIIWAAHFLFVYGFNGIACARGLSSATLWGIGTVPLTVAVATAFAAVGKHDQHKAFLQQRPIQVETWHHVTPGQRELDPPHLSRTPGTPQPE